MNIIEYPWEHAIIDNFYKEELFNIMKVELLTFYKKNHHIT